MMQKKRYYYYYYCTHFMVNKHTNGARFPQFAHNRQLKTQRSDRGVRVLRGVFVFTLIFSHLLITPHPSSPLPLFFPSSPRPLNHPPPSSPCACCHLPIGTVVDDLRRHPHRRAHFALQRAFRCGLK